MGLINKWIKTFPGSEYIVSFIHDIMTSAIRTGPVPRHMAFIMDGNRRYARENNLELHEGHYKGFETAVNVLEACGRMGVKAVTIFAFSIENFKRPPQEINVLFDLIRNRIIPVLSDVKFAHDNGMLIKVIGNRSYLPEDIIEKIELIEDQTKNNNKLILNICFPYTASDDMGHAMMSLIKKAEAGEVDPDLIDAALFEKELYTSGSPPLDIMVRSGNTTRLSDFLMWESHLNCNIVFVKALWPEFSIWDTYRIVLKWSYEKAQELVQLDITSVSTKPSLAHVGLTELSETNLGSEVVPRVADQEINGFSQINGKTVPGMEPL